MKNSIALIVIFSFFALHISAQPKSDCRDVNIDSLYNSNLKIRIPVSSILGSWISNDTYPFKISFEENQNSVVILPQHYINPFAFQIVNDSISTSGSAMNWPLLLQLQSQCRRNTRNFLFRLYARKYSLL